MAFINMCYIILGYIRMLGFLPYIAVLGLCVVGAPEAHFSTHWREEDELELTPDDNFVNRVWAGIHLWSQLSLEIRCDGPCSAPKVCLSAEAFLVQQPLSWAMRKTQERMSGVELSEWCTGLKCSTADGDVQANEGLHGFGSWFGTTVCTYDNGKLSFIGLHPQASSTVKLQPGCARRSTEGGLHVQEETHVETDLTRLHWLLLGALLLVAAPRISHSKNCHYTFGFFGAVVLLSLLLCFTLLGRHRGRQFTAGAFLLIVSLKAARNTLWSFGSLAFQTMCTEEYITVIVSALLFFGLIGVTFVKLFPLRNETECVFEWLLVLLGLSLVYQCCQLGLVSVLFAVSMWCGIQPRLLSMVQHITKHLACGPTHNPTPRPQTTFRYEGYFLTQKQERQQTTEFTRMELNKLATQLQDKKRFNAWFQNICNDEDKLKAMSQFVANPELGYGEGVIRLHRPDVI